MQADPKADPKAPQTYKFIGMIMPAGIPDGISDDKPTKLIVSVCLNINKYCSDFITTNGLATKKWTKS
jgi:hypothetical protein